MCMIDLPIDLALQKDAIRSLGSFPHWKNGFPLYVDVMLDAAYSFVYGLPAGGLTYDILMSLPFEDLRRNCHSMIPDGVLCFTVLAIHHNVIVRRQANSLNLEGNIPYWKRIITVYGSHEIVKCS